MKIPTQQSANNIFRNQRQNSGNKTVWIKPQELELTYYRVVICSKGTHTLWPSRNLELAEAPT